MTRSIIWLILVLLPLIGCSAKPKANPIIMGAAQTSEYLPLLKGKKVGIVANQSSLIGKTHLVDSIISLDISVQKIFSPEHGFRGNQDAGALVKDGKDLKTGLPILSLHGKHRKPAPEHLKGIDVMVFDIQDVGVRFYTYISTMHYVMEACAEANIPVVILDRPNPNGDYVAGPILDTTYQSFVGMHPIPVVHGMTVGELAQMINAEGWLANSISCDLTVIPCKNYTHQTPYSLPIKPSPNLPNDQSIRLYPSLCFFEPTQVSIGRGTYFPFQVIGFPGNTDGTFTFTPKSIKGMSSSPKHQDVACRGLNLQEISPVPTFTLEYLVDAFRAYPNPNEFFTNERFFDLLAGTNTVRLQLIDGKSAEEIEASWQIELDIFKEKRIKYLLYP